MCGIAGLLDLDSSRSSDEIRDIAFHMAKRLAHRGPDGEGLVELGRGRLALAHRRLAIIDTSDAGRQPISTTDGRFTLTYNGEIYNASDLRSRLSHIRFRGHCDAEVLLEHLASHFTCPDPDIATALSELDGMFAFAFHDARRDLLLLGRDRFGEKPLYYTTSQHRFAFASELFAFHGLPGFDRSVDRDALAEYLLLQYVHAPRTIHAEARKLEPGSYMLVYGRGGVVEAEPPRRFARWRSVPDESNGYDQKRHGPAGNVEDPVEKFDQLVRDSVEKRLVSDVPLGILLSGGIDSTLVAAHARMLLGKPVSTFSIGFAGAPESEHLDARRAAQHLDTHHHEEILSPNLKDVIPAVASALDEPMADSSCGPTWLVAQLARRHVRVVLSGDGGDELFGGYQRYADTLRESHSLARRLLWRIRGRGAWSPDAAYCSHRWWLMTQQEVSAIMGLRSLPDGAMATAESMRRSMLSGRAHLIHRMRSLDANTYLPGAVLAKVDRMTMAHGLESRAPLLSSDLARNAASLFADQCFDGRTLKPLLRAALARYVPIEWTRRTKRGFGLPANAWSQESLLRLTNEWLVPGDARLRSILDAVGLNRFLAAQHDPRRFRAYQLYSLLILEQWLRCNR